MRTAVAYTDHKGSWEHALLGGGTSMTAIAVKLQIVESDPNERKGLVWPSKSVMIDPSIGGQTTPHPIHPATAWKPANGNTLYVLTEDEYYVVVSGSGKQTLLLKSRQGLEIPTEVPLEITALQLERVPFNGDLEGEVVMPVRNDNFVPRSAAPTSTGRPSMDDKRMRDYYWHCPK